MRAIRALKRRNCSTEATPTELFRVLAVCQALEFENNRQQRVKQDVNAFGFGAWTSLETIDSFGYYSAKEMGDAAGQLLVVMRLADNKACDVQVRPENLVTLFRHCLQFGECFWPFLTWNARAGKDGCCLTSKKDSQ